MSLDLSSIRGATGTPTPPLPSAQAQKAAMGADLPPQASTGLAANQGASRAASLGQDQARVDAALAKSAVRKEPRPDPLVQQAEQDAAKALSQEQRDRLEEAIARLNDQVRRNARDLEFSIDETLDRPMITVRSRESGEVIRQIPTEAVLRIAYNIEDLKGLMLNEKI